MDNGNKRYMAYVGTYTSDESEGIYAYQLDSRTGKLEAAGLAAKVNNPSYLAIEGYGGFLYAVSENELPDGVASGAVTGYSIDKNTGALTFINNEIKDVKAFCHLVIDKAGRNIFASSYSEGVLDVFPLAEDGSVCPVSFSFRHQGTGPNKERQEKAHIHYAMFTPDGRYLCAVDLGIDRIMLYEYDAASGSLRYDEERSVNILPGSGPRHMVFRPDGKYAYLLNELRPDIAVLRYYHDRCVFGQVQYTSLLPEGFDGENYGAAIKVSPDGRFLYASNRGHDSIAVLRICEENGLLEPVSHVSTCGSWPRDFAIDPSGSFLFALNQYSSSIVTFAIDRKTGILERINDAVHVPDPACMVFAKML